MLCNIKTMQSLKSSNNILVRYVYTKLASLSHATFSLPAAALELAIYYCEEAADRSDWMSLTQSVLAVNSALFQWECNRVQTQDLVGPQMTLFWDGFFMKTDV